MLTFQTLLQAPIFAEATLVAGRRGVHKRIEWSHIIDVPDVVGNVGPNCLIITTGQGLPAQPQQQVQFIESLHQAGIAGMVLSIGKILSHPPAALVRAADSCNFPLITVPWTQRFVEVTRYIHEQVVSEQYTLLKKSDHIHQTLNQIVLEGGGLQELAEVLARLVERAVTIEDPELNVMAYAPHGEVDPARERSIAAGGTPDSIRRFLHNSRILHRINQNLRPTVVRAQPEHGMTKDRIVAPIVVEREVYGYLWLIAGADPLNEADSMAIERAVVVAALTMLKDIAVQQTEARLQADVISQLLSEHTHTPALQDKANRLGLDLNQPQRVLLLQPPRDTLPSLRLARRLRGSLRPFGRKYLLQPLGQYLVLITPDGVDPLELSHTLVEILPGLRVGIGQIAPALTQLAQSYHQAKEALNIGQALNVAPPIYNFATLGVLHWLYQLPPEVRDNNPYIARIEILAEDDRAARAQLLQTLEVFLDCGGNASETARVLQIHRNTLSYRLKQIENLGRVSLSDPSARLNLQVAIKAYRLNQGLQKETLPSPLPPNTNLPPAQHKEDGHDQH